VIFDIAAHWQRAPNLIIGLLHYFRSRGSVAGAHINAAALARRLARTYSAIQRHADSVGGSLAKITRPRSRSVDTCGSAEAAEARGGTQMDRSVRSPGDPEHRRLTLPRADAEFPSAGRFHQPPAHAP
jgi:hypothetical protein